MSNCDEVYAERDKCLVLIALMAQHRATQRQARRDMGI
jgi:hypothetical protein